MCDLLVMCAPCFKALGPLEEKSIGRILAPAVMSCAFCGRMLTQEEWQASHAIHKDAAPHTFQENMDRAYAAFQALEKVMPGLVRLEVGRTSGVLHGEVSNKPPAAVRELYAALEQSIALHAATLEGELGVGDPASRQHWLEQAAVPFKDILERYRALVAKEKN